MPNVRMSINKLMTNLDWISNINFILINLPLLLVIAEAFALAIGFISFND